jgi:hypothetical protein
MEERRKSAISWERREKLLALTSWFQSVIVLKYRSINGLCSVRSLRQAPDRNQV